LKNVKQFLSGYFSHIKIICYLREQGATCASWYSTSMKSGGIDSFFDFVRRCKPEVYYYNYLELLNKWESFFGIDALEVAVFDPERFLNGSLLDDFTSRIDSALVGELDNIVRAENESLSPAGQAVARAINMTFPVDSSGPEVGDTRDRLKEIVAGRLSGKGQQLSPAMRLSVYESFVESNEQVRKKFFPDSEILFPRPVDAGLTGAVIGEEIFSVLGDLFRTLGAGSQAESTEEYERFWAALSISIGDAVAIRQGLGRPGVQVVLTEEDGRLLNSAANKVMGLDLDLAEMLLGLAATANRRLPGLTAKLEHIQKKHGEGRKHNFIITYHGGRRPHDEEEGRQADATFIEWASALDVLVGSPINPLTGKRLTISSDHVQENDELHFHAFSIFKAGSLDEAVAIAQTCPHLSFGGRVEVIRLESFEDMLLESLEDIKSRL
jgi:hypothetical protein